MNTALENFWVFFWTLCASAFGPSLLASLVAVVLYLRSPESTWIYALLKYALVFLSGTLLPILVLTCLALIGIRRRKKKERDRVHKYASTEKAWIDYGAEIEPAFEGFRGSLAEIGKETIQVGVRSGQLIKAVLIRDAQQRRTKTSKEAKKLNKHCLKMELAAERLKAARDAYLEACEGLLRSTTSASQGNGPKLTALAEAFTEIDSAAITVINTQRELIAQSKEVHGRVSMDVNTSMNWLIAVCEENIRIVEEFKSKTSNTLFPLLQRKLET